MIRRRSCITIINQNFTDFIKFYKIKRRRLFRSALNYKKYFTLRTKFKRRHLRKLKHGRNFLIYYNVLKYWTDDYRITKRWVRFQYYNRFFLNNSIVTNDNQWVRHQEKTFPQLDQLVVASITTKFLRALRNDSFKFVSLSYKGTNHVHAFYPSSNMLPQSSITEIISIYDLQTFANNVVAFSDNDEIDDFDLIDDYLFFVVFSQIIEIYKILIFLLYASNFKNLNIYVFKLF